MTEHADTQTETPVPPLPSVPTETVELDSPITRGKQTVTEIHVRKPKSGALRGVALTDVLQMDVQALTKVLPRITDPALTEPEIRDMDPADLVQLGTVVANFLLPRRMQADAAS
ncbi:phage tail assembly protein [Halomonas korlensis]|uniref:Phage tail assembly chaperone protein, E, or 41 or 14 n=1 Tax=Halomonas korlensis TaxID=463301 RepID=A0A1I7J493_9GAMM|nr:phage tail assembly protein [Halomonas korlensis]SFU79998.1 Phage tail assembly chaperone protein, E, or 41 or 14 [Halomonas korlensis]